MLYVYKTLQIYGALYLNEVSNLVGAFVPGFKFTKSKGLCVHLIA